MNILPAPPIAEDFQGPNPLPAEPVYGWIPVLAHWSRAAIVQDPLDPLNKVLSVTVQPGDTLNANGNPAPGERCEFEYQPADPAGYERHFDLEVMIPSDYTDPQPGEWQHLLQFHDQPEDGDWNGFPHNSPPISLDYDYAVVSTLPQSIVDFWNLNFPGWAGLVVADRISTLSVTVGVATPKDTVMIVPFSKGSWQKIGLDIKWSHDGIGGFVKCYHNDVLLGEHLGRNMHNDFVHNVRFGIYRFAQAFPNTVLFKSFNKS